MKEYVLDKMNYFKNIMRNFLSCILYVLVPELKILKSNENNWFLLKSNFSNSVLGKQTKLFKPYNINNTEIGDYTYIAHNCTVSKTKIGKFCSIGPNFLCGWGIHPIDGITTSPMFYSSLKQNGITLSKVDKVVERKEITVGNDVFIGANVTVLDGITIGDGAIIGAGAVVSKNIPAYAIAVGNPIKIIKYRFDEKQIDQLIKIKWWNFNEKELVDVEKLFFNVDEFIDKYKNV